jgi:hypothetical protein
MAEARARLWFRKIVPYEHEVIPREQLHPEVRDEVDEILEVVRQNRYTTAIYSGFAGAHMPLGVGVQIVASAIGLVGVGASAVNAVKTLGSESPNRVLRRAQVARRRGERFGGLDYSATINFLIPYAIPSRLTRRLGVVIKSVSARGESPFSRLDSPELLKRFHYGVVDNRGNLILLSHPRASQTRGWELLKKMFLWEQPFQRTRFEIQKPEFPARERVKKPVAAVSPLRFAFAPVRLPAGLGRGR